MPLWEIKAVIRGHNDRLMVSHRTAWDSSRWQTYCILKAMGVKSLMNPKDLVTFPWEKEEKDAELSDEEVESLRSKITAMNERKTPEP